MSISSGLAAWKLTFQLAPIIMTGGIASAIPGGMLPAISLTEALNFTTGLLSGAGDDLDENSFFANFAPLPGSTLIDNQVATYPFANMQVAANGIIAQPLRLSMLMICPARGDSGYALKLATMTALVSSFQQHNNSEGLYTVATPVKFWDNMIMTRMSDVSAALSKQPQSSFQIDFIAPLVTLAQAAQAQNAMMSAISGGAQTDGSLSGLNSTLGAPGTIATPNVVPAASSPGGASIGNLY